MPGSFRRSAVSNRVMREIVRESVLAGIVMALVLVFTVQIQRSETPPTPPAMLAFFAAPPPSPGVTSKAMPTPSFMSELDTAAQELRGEPSPGAFKRKLAHIVGILGTIPDSSPLHFTKDDLIRLRELAEETVEAVERRIESGGDDEKAQQQLAGTVYEIRRRMEAVEIWFRHFANEP